MNQYVVDTHILIWHLVGDPRMPDACRAVMEAADRGEAKIWIPTIVLVETVYLGEKLRVPAELIGLMLDAVDAGGSYEAASLDVDAVRALMRIDRNVVPDMPDRIVAATAVRKGAPLLSKDSRIRRLPGLVVIG